MAAVHCAVKAAQLWGWSVLDSSGGPSVSPRLTDLVKLAQECCYHSNLPVAAYGVIVLTNITVSCPDKG